mmetsp:Transcript_14934/g.44263  ORF Transcript_14934/g.44263 Transcript_14934/m.44263 type:complete len:228 (+) Transcript_14934:517-1200(+)
MRCSRRTRAAPARRRAKAASGLKASRRGWRRWWRRTRRGATASASSSTRATSTALGTSRRTSSTCCCTTRAASRPSVWRRSWRRRSAGSTRTANSSFLLRHRVAATAGTEPATARGGRRRAHLLGRVRGVLREPAGRAPAAHCTPRPVCQPDHREAGDVARRRGPSASSRPARTGGHVSRGVRPVGERTRRPSRRLLAPPLRRRAARGLRPDRHACGPAPAVPRTGH